VSEGVRWVGWGGTAVVVLGLGAVHVVMRAQPELLALGGGVHDLAGWDWHQQALSLHTAHAASGQKPEWAAARGRQGKAHARVPRSPPPSSCPTLSSTCAINAQAQLVQLEPGARGRGRPLALPPPAHPPAAREAGAAGVQGTCVQGGARAVEVRAAGVRCKTQ